MRERQKKEWTLAKKRRREEEEKEGSGRWEVGSGKRKEQGREGAGVCYFSPLSYLAIRYYE
jgi:hypothetical protein